MEFQGSMGYRVLATPVFEPRSLQSSPSLDLSAKFGLPLLSTEGKLAGRDPVLKLPFLSHLCWDLNSRSPRANLELWNLPAFCKHGWDLL